MNKAIILDRDGTIIVDKLYLNDPNKIEYLPHAFDGLQKFRDAGYIFVVATNQSGVPRGIVSLENLHEIHRRMDVKLKSEGIDVLSFYYAPYMTESGHPMRKPGIGMAELAAKEHNIDLTKSWFIGDKMSDVESGHRAGMKSIFIKGTEDPAKSDYAPAELECDNLLQAAEFIINNDANN